MAKGRSSIKQKELDAKKRMYTPKQQMAYKPCGCDPPMIPIGADAKAEFKLKGGYDTRRSNICDIHHIARSKSGKCIECD